MASSAAVCLLCGESAQACGEAAGLTLARCRSCGTVSQRDLPSPDEIRGLYREKDYYASWGLEKSYARVEAMKRLSFRRVFEKLERRVRPGRLLDVGCATGFLMAEGESRGWEAHGAELNAYAAGVARRRFGARVHAGPLETLAEAPGSFRAVTLVDVIEHVSDPRAVLARARDLLEPGGVLVVVTPDVRSLSARVLGRWWPHYKREHLFYPTRQGFDRVLAGLGLKTLELRGSLKALTPDYLISQFTAYPMPLVTPALSLAGRLLPAPLKNLNLWLPSGDMLGLFQKP